MLPGELLNTHASGLSLTGKRSGPLYGMLHPFFGSAAGCIPVVVRAAYFPVFPPLA